MSTKQKVIRIEMRVVVEDAEDWRRSLEWSVRRVYEPASLRALRQPMVSFIASDFEGDMEHMLRVALAESGG